MNEPIDPQDEYSANAFLNGKLIGKAKPIKMTFATFPGGTLLTHSNIALLLSIGRSLDDQFGEHPPRIFHEGP